MKTRTRDKELDQNIPSPSQTPDISNTNFSDQKNNRTNLLIIQFFLIKEEPMEELLEFPFVVCVLVDHLEKNFVNFSFSSFAMD
jgi:hypothetical protein